MTTKDVSKISASLMNFAYALVATLIPVVIVMIVFLIFPLAGDKTTFAEIPGILVLFGITFLGIAVTFYLQIAQWRSSHTFPKYMQLFLWFACGFAINILWANQSIGNQNDGLGSFFGILLLGIISPLVAGLLLVLLLPLWKFSECYLRASYPSQTE